MPNPLTPAPPSGFRTLGYPSSGIAFQAPTNWSVATEKAPLVAIIDSGSAVVAVWRYSRAAAPPAPGSALNQAKGALIAAARARDSSLQVIRSSIVKVDGVGGVELDAIERIDGQVRRVRSTHVFVSGAELVVDEYAPPTVFHAVDHAVFSPLKRSLRLSAVP